MYTLCMINGVESQVSPEVVSQAVSSLDKYILNHYGKLTRRTLRGRQITVVEDLRDTLRGGQTEGYVTIPTGVGKTVLFTEVTEALNEQEILETMIVVPTKILVDQTGERFHQFAPDLEVGKLYTFAHDVTRPVTITTYASLVRHIQGGTLDPNLYKLLVLDEVHRSLSGRRSQAVAQFINAIKLGFTATPMYSEDKNVANLLNTEIHKMSTREAVEEDLLSPFSAIIAQTDVDLSNVSIKSSGDYDDKELEEAINIASRNQAAVDLYQRLFQGQTTVAYCTSVRHAQAVAELFSEKGISAGYISGYQDKKEQAEILKKYHQGEIKVLCNADILIEGFDEPKVSVCLNLRPTKSVVVAQQRGGRVLRLNPDNPNKHAVIVDFLDKTDDPRKLSVTFAEVAEAARILTKKTRERAHLTDTSNDSFSDDLNRTLNDDLREDLFDFEEDIISISGLKVIVNPQEVMRIVKEIQEKELLRIQDTDIPITYTNLRTLFIGEQSRLIGVAHRIMQRIRTTDPEGYHKLFARRLVVVSTSDRATEHTTFPIDVCTDTKEFIRLMQAEGVTLRTAGISPDLNPKPLDFPLTYSNITGNLRISWSKFKDMLEQLKNKLKNEDAEEYNKLFSKRIGKNNLPYEVATNKERFSELLNVELKIQDPTAINVIVEVSNELNYIYLSKDFLGNLFKAGIESIRENLEKVKSRIKKERPDDYENIFILTKRNGQIVEACTDRELLIKYMADTGVKLRVSD